MITGPFTYEDRSQPTTTTDGQGNTITTYPALPGAYYITDGATYARSQDVLAAYLVTPDPLQHELGGVPTITLKFADQTSGDAVVGPINALPPIPAPSPTPPPPVAARTLSVYDFLMRFPTDKRIAIRAAQASDPVVSDWMDLMNHVPSINLDDPNTQAGVNYLVSKGYITSAEAAGVLA